MAMKKFIKENRLLLSIIAGVIVGCIIGVSSHESVQSSVDPSPRRFTMYIKFPGELFIRMLRMSGVPLITSSIIVALTDIDIAAAGHLGKRTMIYYGTTTVFSCILGIIMGMLVRPGSGVNEENPKTKAEAFYKNTVDNFLDLLRNAFPANIVEATFNSVYTTYKETGVNYRFNMKNVSELNQMTVIKLAKFLQDNIIAPESLNISPSGHELVLIDKSFSHDFGGVTKGGGTNTIGLIVFSVAFGIVLNLLKEDGKPLVNVFRSLWKATMKLVELIMWVGPLGMASVIAGNMVETKDVSTLFRAMGMFMVANAASYVIQAGFLYPSLYFIFHRRFPWKHLKAFLPAYITAFGTSSSAATLPTTMECSETRAKIDERVSRFVLPIGATCNMDGSAAFFAITVIFIDQIEPDVDLGIAETVLTIVVCTAISIGSSGVPSAGLVSVIIVLESVGLPIDKLGPVYAVIWIVDRLQTTVNVMGDTYAVAIIEKTSQRDLAKDHALQNLDSKEDEAVQLRSLASVNPATDEGDVLVQSNT